MLQAKNVFKYRIRGHVPRAKVVVRDLPAFNGIIHVVNELLINDPNIEGDVTVSISAQFGLHLVIVVEEFVVVIVVAVVV